MVRKWHWQPRDRSNFWEKASTVAKEYGEPIVRLLQVPGSFVPGLSKALEKADALFGSDLNISDLDSAEVVQALNAVAGPFESLDASSPVFVDGVMAAVTVSHNGKGQEIILLERVDLCLIEYSAGRIRHYEVESEGEEIFGAGMVDPFRYFIEVDKDGFASARRTIKAQDGKTEMLIAQSPNILDTDPAAFLSFGPKDPPAMFRFTITAKDTGLYLLCLRWFYRISGKELRQYTSLPIMIYRRA